MRRHRNIDRTPLRALRAALAITVAGALAAVAAPAAPAAATTDADYPVHYSFAAGLAASLARPGSAPPGANDWTCRPGGAHPYPVILVHGTFGNMTNSWQALSALLANDDYCVYALNYGGRANTDQFHGYGDIVAGGAALAAFVDRVLRATGAAKVDIVGHSQGGMMPRYYVGFLGGAGKVNRLVGLAPSNHGTNLNGLTALLHVFPGGSDALAAICTACAQQVAGSPFMTRLNGIGDTVAGVRYTVIATRYDTVVTPYTSAFLVGSAVTNITLQDRCALDLSDHLGVAYDRIALRYVLNALDPAHAVNPGCTLVLPVVSG